MGTDIHMYIERRGAKAWEYVSGEEDINRNYDLFGMLADVRNGSGFAGCDTGDGFVPISAPRGFPADASKRLKGRWDREGEHTPSWLTVRELLDYDWSRSTKRRGYVNATTYAAWVKAGRVGSPVEWCGGVDGPMIKHLSNADMDLLVATGSGSDNHYTQIEWSVTYSDAAGSFFEKMIPKLREIGDPDMVRIVFWFDS